MNIPVCPKCGAKTRTQKTLSWIGHVYQGTSHRQVWGTACGNHKCGNATTMKGETIQESRTNYRTNFQ